MGSVFGITCGAVALAAGSRTGGRGMTSSALPFGEVSSFSGAFSVGVEGTELFGVVRERPLGSFLEGPDSFEEGVWGSWAHNDTGALRRSAMPITPTPLAPSRALTAHP